MGVHVAHVVGDGEGGGHQEDWGAHGLALEAERDERRW